MSKKNSDGFDVSAYRKDLTKTLLMEFFKIVESQGKHYGDDFAANLLMDYHTSLITTIVYSTLKSGASAPTQEEAYRITTEAFAALKQDIADSVGMAFSAAFQEFDPKASPDYTCEITCLDTGYQTGPTH